MFREAILAALGAGQEQRTENEYCSWCKAANPDVDCAACSKKIEMLNPAGASKTAASSTL